jgi:peptide/nickel transport system substrate-binding protein
MGTGPFMLKEWQPDQKLVLVPNPLLVGQGQDQGNVTEIIYTPIKSEATRMAALLSGEVDFVLDPSLQDLGRIKRAAQSEGDRWAGEPHHLLRHGPVPRRTARLQHQGQEPAEGPARAQGAVPGHRHRSHQARDHARPEPAHGCAGGAAGERLDQGVDKRFAYDPEAAKKLLADAGYPQGFEVDFACPNNRYINDEEICQAVTAMWAKVGVKAKLRTCRW